MTLSGNTIEAPAAPTGSMRPGGATILVSAEPGELRPMWEQVALFIFVGGPVLALAAGVTLSIQGHGITWLDGLLFAVMYAVSAVGITVGFHRHFTHGSFKANRGLHLALAIAGSLAVQGPIVRWVADHRKHHKFSDRDGDPHSPWLAGPGVMGVIKGLWWSHIGWLFDREQTSKQTFAPDLMADADVQRVHALFPLWVAVSLLAAPLTALAVTGGSWSAFWSAMIWASLVRIMVLHHVTWSINSICHVFGERPFRSRDKSTNVWWLAVPSMGESWHNLHHAEPTSARHGVDRGQIDISAAVIRGFERLGWATDVRWPRPERLNERRSTSTAQASGGDTAT